MTNSQEFIPIENVSNNLIFLKDGSVGILISVSAVNFALLFETEQVSIIDSFAGLINSLSFPIQIIIHSRVLDVSAYLHTIDKALIKQTNPLLIKMTKEYRAFVEKSIKDNNVLDKKFYICIKITPIEIGFLPSSLEEKVNKVTTMLMPRRDHLMRQLNRLGLKPKPLISEEIIKLFYEIYNPPVVNSAPETISAGSAIPGPQPAVKTTLRPLRTSLSQSPTPAPSALQPTPVTPPITATAPAPVPPPIPQPSPLPSSLPNQAQLSSPFVVEELADE